MMVLPCALSATSSSRSCLRPMGSRPLYGSSSSSRAGIVHERASRDRAVGACPSSSACLRIPALVSQSDLLDQLVRPGARRAPGHAKELSDQQRACPSRSTAGRARRPRRGIRCARAMRTLAPSSPKISTRPRSGRSSPRMIFMVVDLPGAVVAEEAVHLAPLPTARSTPLQDGCADAPETGAEGLVDRAVRESPWSVFGQGRLPEV